MKPMDEQRDECTGSSPYPGVTRDNRQKKWRSQIRVGDRVVYIGMYKEEHDAAVAYRAVKTVLDKLGVEHIPGLATGYKRSDSHD